MQPVLSPPGRGLVVEIETVATPGMADEVMDGTKPVERTPDLTVEERMKALPSGSGRGHLESPIGAHRQDELFVAFVGLGATGEGHSHSTVAGVSSQESEKMIRFHLESPVGLNHLGIAMSTPRMQIPLTDRDGRRLNSEGCVHLRVVAHLRSSVPPFGSLKAS